MAKFGKVIIDIASSLVDKVFDYILPYDIEVGTRVLVPFGRQVKEGYLVEKTDVSDYDADKLKQIIKPIDDFVVIKKDQFELAKFLKQKYNIGLCDSFRLFLPSEMRTGKVKELVSKVAYISDDETAKAYMANLRSTATKQRAVLAYLLEVGEDKCSKINAQFGAGALKKLIDDRIVLVREETVLRKPLAELSAKPNNVVLTKDQQRVVDTISTKTGKYLIHGVTGSGKTEIYMALMKKTLDQGKTGIMLVPEISLTPQVVANFRARFGDEVALMHSALSAGERFDEWRRILLGKAKIVVGARSAIFSPTENLGLIVIDEEHDGSYTSESNPRYHTIEVAEKRAEICGCSLVLGSATPDLETYHKAIVGEYHLLELKERINKKPMPPLEIVDMCAEVQNGNNEIFSERLKTELKNTLDTGNQAMIFINRRGYASFLMCKDCGYVPKCQNCDTALVYHKHDNALKCHFCSARYKVFSECPECHSKNLKFGSVGTQQVVEEIEKLFPGTKVLRMDNDTTSQKNGHYKILSQFRDGKAQVLVGTQMIVKGHDFPAVTLVGIVDADQSLYQSSYTATERTFQLITQVAGRAGRADLQGKIILQTYVPRHYVYRLASGYDYLSFYKKEANLREMTNFPPFTKIVRVLFSSDDEELAKNSTKVYYDSVKDLSLKHSGQFVYLGVSKSPVGRIQNKYRYQVLMRLKLEESDDIITQLYRLCEENKKNNVSCFVEINPQSLS
ncbi:MAG: primosomal protein N' [Clostridia bacterium]|nr:primosomal protein N' [Clostridia bacterium]